MLKFINVYCQQPKINWYFVLHSTKYHPIFVLSIIINAKTYFPTRLIKQAGWEEEKAKRP